MAERTTPAAPPPAKKSKSECHSCHATVVWVLLEGKRTPLDHLPDGGGNVAIEPELFPREGADHAQRARFVSGVTTHYRRHLDSCPDAAKWRDRWKRTAERPYSKIERKKTR